MTRHRLAVLCQFVVHVLHEIIEASFVQSVKVRAVAGLEFDTRHISASSRSVDGMPKWPSSPITIGAQADRGTLFVDACNVENPSARYGCDSHVGPNPAERRHLRQVHRAATIGPVQITGEPNRSDDPNRAGQGTAT
jgi:hypothetical protein